MDENNSMRLFKGFRDVHFPFYKSPDLIIIELGILWEAFS